MRSRSSFFYAAAGLTLAWATLLWVGIEQPMHPSAEESHYIPAAREILAHGIFNNPEHPPLGKTAIALGMAALGDNPRGWRVGSVILSVFFFIGILRLALALGFTAPQALLGGTFVAVNGIAFTLGRLAMLEMPMLALLVWAIAHWLESHKRAARTPLILSGTFFGFSAAMKWSGGLGFLLTLGATFFLLLLRRWKVSFGARGGGRLQAARRSESEFYRDSLWQDMRPHEVLAAFVIPAAISYFLAFLPLYGTIGGWRTPAEWFSLQFQMWEMQQRVTQTHPYGSVWHEWFIPSRAIWFEFTREALGRVRAIFVLTNPVTTALGCVGAVLAVRKVLRERDFTAFWLLYFYLALYLVFAVIPRSLSFYYYYAPAATFWTLLGVWGLSQLPVRLRNFSLVFALVGAVGVFSYFYPLYAAQLIQESTVPQWAWLRSWI